MSGDDQHSEENESRLSQALSSDEAPSQPEEADSNPDHLFVYGTLKRGFSNPMATYLTSNAVYHSTAIMAGKLYDLGPFPGLVLDDDGSIVHGELYKIKRPNTLLSLLDAYEACAHDDPRPHDFMRISVTVRDQDGVDVRAWVYMYQGPLQDMRLIDDGIYRPKKELA